ncbi:MAG: alpha,alpha-trehalose-phosphate synthase (UDP-forming) [Anaerolineae bacterium]
MNAKDSPEEKEVLESKFLAERSLIIVANRGPVTFRRTDEGDLEFERGKGGLVTALIGLCNYTEATWIASARTEADEAWESGEVPITEDLKIRVRFIAPGETAYADYYGVIANPLLWFLQHSMWDIPRTPVIDRDTWDAWEGGYVAVNHMFAEAIVEQVKASERRPLVMLQDYHLYTTARPVWMELDPGERPTVLHFIHIPWPGPEYWRILPPQMREAILDSLCATDLLGFQTSEDALNFLRTCESLLPNAHVKYQRGRVWYRNHHTYVRDFPISIDVEALRATARSPEVAAYREEFEQLIGENTQLVVRIDRLEPSKNILRGFQAFSEMLDLYPEHRGKVKFLALLVPSRLGVGEYQDYLDELMAAAGHINAAHGSSDWEPVRLIVGQNYPRAVAAMQMYDALLVNSIADGMNLVAKEGSVVNERDGVLILSERTGARQQLESGALIIPPCDIYNTAQAIHEALVMPRKERRERLQRLRAIVEEQDITAWLHDQLAMVAKLKL